MSARAISEASGKRLLNEQLGVETGAGTCRLNIPSLQICTMTFIDQF